MTDLQKLYPHMQPQLFVAIRSATAFIGLVHEQAKEEVAADQPAKRSPSDLR